MAIGTQSLVGREEQLASLLALFDDPERLPALAVVAGEAGIGKTALWLAAVEAGAGAGYRTLSCRPTEAETAYSFAGLADLVGGVAGDVVPTFRRHSGALSRLRSESRKRPIRSTSVSSRSRS